MGPNDAGLSFSWWQLALVANAVISLAYLAIAALILVPLARAHQLRSNTLAVATGLIFASCSVGHGMHALQPALNPGVSMDTWWLASWHTLTALVAIYYLAQRRLYGQLLSSAPLFHDTYEQQRLADLEELAVVNAARVSAEEQRDADSAMMQAIIQNSQSLIYVKDLEGRYVMTNRAFDRCFDLPADAMIGLSNRDIDPALATAMQPNDNQVLLGLSEVEEFNELPDGRHYFETAMFPLHDPHGEIYATCGVSLDVTQRRRAAAQEIERDAALAANVAKSTFLATMSHEIRTPMNAVIGMTDLLLGGPLDGRQRECVETLRSSGDALLALINDVLDFSKIESGDLELESAAFDLGAEAEAGLDLVLPAAAAKGLELVCDLPEDGSLRVLGDAHRVRQILLNLLSNAVKFTERGEIVLRISTSPVAGHQVRAIVSVTDTGMGISPENVDRLFRSYGQEDASTTRLHGGSGLGLAISRKLALAMGGELALASSATTGSTFVFDVVLDRAPAADPALPVPGAHAPPLAGRSALLVDDNQTTLRILDYQLGILGLACTSFTSPLAALAAVIGGLHYDVAVLDLHMPELGGDSLGAALRELPQGRDAPVVLLTSLGSEPAGPRPSFAAFVTKPAKRAALHETVIRVLTETETPEDVMTVEATGAEDPVERRVLRVLLAEDNAVNQRVARLMLERLGHSVDDVCDGLAAVAAVTSGSYDVVLMDVQMPELDGLEATRRIRSRVPQDQLPYIVAMTANALQQHRGECLAAGMHDYLSKPVRIAELEAVLATAEGRSSLSAAEEEPAVDDAVLRALMDDLGADDSSILDELIETYLAEADGYLIRLRELVRVEDHAQIRAVSHTWRSTSAMLGARRLEELLQRLEATATRGSDDCTLLSSEVEHEYGRVKKALSPDG